MHLKDFYASVCSTERLYQHTLFPALWKTVLFSSSSLITNTHYFRKYYLSSTRDRVVSKIVGVLFSEFTFLQLVKLNFLCLLVIVLLVKLKNWLKNSQLILFAPILFWFSHLSKLCAMCHEYFPCFVVILL